MVPEVRERLLELLDAGLGNASANHDAGRRARAVIDDARQRIAGALEVSEESLLFTSGGTESNNAALRGALAAAQPGVGLVVSTIEHASVLETARALGAEGRPLAFAPVDEYGVLRVAECATLAAERHCGLISVMLANNEVGAIAPVAELAEALEDLGAARPLWHCDAVQALGRLPLRLRKWGIDLASFSGHKIGGPSGVGLLYRRPGVDLGALLTGGGQETGLRSGTENVPAIGALALAVERAVENRAAYASRSAAQTMALWCGLRDKFPGARVAGPGFDADERLPNTLNILFEQVDGRTLVARLDLEGVEASLGSACASGASEVSHVLLAMGYTSEEARSALRLSIGWNTTDEDIHRAVDIMGRTIPLMRASP